MPQGGTGKPRVLRHHTIVVGLRQQHLARAEQDPQKRKALYTSIIDLYQHHKPTLPLVHVKQLLAVDKRISYIFHPFETRLSNASFVKKQ